MKPLLTLLLFGLVSSSFSATPKRILFVGNSYTGGIKSTLNAMLKHEQIDAEVKYINPGGKTLAWHAANGTLEEIKNGQWDLVVLQEQSQTPAYPAAQERFWEAGARLCQAIKAQGARPVYYMTWGRRDGDKQNPAAAPNYAVMQDRLSASYEKAAEEQGAGLAPCGEVWRLVRKMDPELGQKLYRKDGSHPSPHGSYLVAATFMATLFEQVPGEIQYTGALSPEERETVLQAITHLMAP